MRAGRRPLGWLVAFNLAAILAIAVLTGLGIWQVQRRAWKLDLIERVESRIHAAPTPAPGPTGWPAITAEADAYRHLRLSGVFDHDRTTLVQAVTALGGGFWALTPLRTAEGFTVLVDRGFVPGDKRDPSGWQQPDGSVTLTGLMRMSEPGGAFLRSNDPAANRWFSRDVAAIAAARGLSDTAPYFVDAAATPQSSLPVGGLTVVDFPNNHLVYAITWFTLAAMLAGAILFVDRDVLKAQRGLGSVREPRT